MFHLFRRRNQQNSSTITNTASSFVTLIQRIHNQHLQDVRVKFVKSNCNRWGRLFIYLLVLMIFQCPNRVYNAWMGPFPMNLNQFQNHLETNYNLFGYRSFFSFRWLSFQPEYIQIEFDEEVIDFSVQNSFEYSYIQAIYGRVTYTYNRVIEPTIARRYKSLYLKFVSYDRSKYETSHSYQLRSFNINTLQCIAKNLGIVSTEFVDSNDKSIYIKKIEEIYNSKSHVSNMMLMVKCNFIIGYLDKPRGISYFNGYINKYHEFNDDIRIFDSTCPYTPYISNILIYLFIYFLLKNLIRTFQILKNFVNITPHIHFPSIMDQLRKSNIISLENLNELLLNTSYIDNYYDHFFIINNRYLVMFMINLNEKSPKILREFYENAPFRIIPIDTIITVKMNHIVLYNQRNYEYIYFPSFINSYHFAPANWLHERLMLLSNNYRHHCEMQELRNQDAERQRHFNFLVAEETQYQQRQNEHDISRILQRTASASPRFIASFRFHGPTIVNNDMLCENCAICLEDYRLNRQFAQWPCTAQHTFHFNCMLKVLRTGHTCPLCRYPVEAADLPDIQYIFQLMAQRTRNFIFN